MSTTTLHKPKTPPENQAIEATAPAGSLEQCVGQQSSAAGQRIFSFEEYKNLLSAAFAFQQIEIATQEGNEKAIIAAGLPSVDQGFTEQDIYQIASTDLGLESRFVDKAMQHYTISRDKHLADIKSLHARIIPPPINIYDIKDKYGSALLAALHSYYPSLKFEIQKKSRLSLFFETLFDIPSFKIIQKEEKKNPLCKLSMLKLDPHSCSMGIDVYKPEFIEACKDSLVQLKTYFSKELSIGSPCINIRYDAHSLKE